MDAWPRSGWTATPWSVTDPRSSRLHRDRALAGFVGQRPAELVAVEALEVGEEVEHDRGPRRCSLDLEQRVATGAQQLPELHPLRVACVPARVDLLDRLLVRAYAHERLELPVLAIVAELVAAVALDDAAGLGLHDVQVLADRQQDLFGPGHAFLQYLQVDAETVVILVAAHHQLRRRPGKGAVDQVAEHGLVVRRHAMLLTVRRDVIGSERFIGSASPRTRRRRRGSRTHGTRSRNVRRAACCRGTSPRPRARGRGVQCARAVSSSTPARARHGDDALGEAARALAGYRPRRAGRRRRRRRTPCTPPLP